MQLASIESKQAPAAQALQQAYEEQQREMQAQFKAQAESDAQLVRLGQEGKIDPAEVQAERWSKALGRSIPASAFRGKAGTVEQRKNALEDDINDITKFLGQFRKGGIKGIRWGQRIKYKDPTMLDAGGKPIERDIDPSDPRSPDAPLLKKRSDWIQALKQKQEEFSELLISNDPVLGPAARIQKDWATANTTLSKNGRKGGGLSAGIIQAKGKPPLPPIGETIQRLRAGGLEREGIRAQLKVLGYK